MHVLVDLTGYWFLPCHFIVELIGVCLTQDISPTNKNGLKLRCVGVKLLCRLGKLLTAGGVTHRRTLAYLSRRFGGIDQRALGLPRLGHSRSNH